MKYFGPTIFLALELIAKEPDRQNASLRSWLGATMPVAQALLFALQIARGLAHAVRKIPGFVHRNLKPENVLVGVDKLPGTAINRLRVTDFGLATILQSNVEDVADEEGQDVLRRTHLTRGILGTPLYMAPEQWLGDAVGVYTNVYALGCIPYEMLTGVPAAAGRRTNALKIAHCEGDLRSLPGDLPENVRTFLTHSLARQTDQRYADWKTVIHALEEGYTALISSPAPEEPTRAMQSAEAHHQEGWSYNAMGLAYSDLGQAEVTIEYYEQSLAIACDIGDRRMEGAALGNLGIANLNLGEGRRAIGFYEQCLALHRVIGDRRGEGNALGT